MKDDYTLRKIIDSLQVKGVDFSAVDDPKTGKVINYINVKSGALGIRQWGRVDYLVNYHGYKLRILK